ncbi:MAG: hypothetical protein Q9159_007032 [Coniocarpon cinnabarinum]
MGQSMSDFDSESRGWLRRAPCLETGGEIKFAVAISTEELAQRTHQRKKHSQIIEAEFAHDEYSDATAPQRSDPLQDGEKYQSPAIAVKLQTWGRRARRSVAGRMDVHLADGRGPGSGDRGVLVPGLKGRASKDKKSNCEKGRAPKACKRN